MITHADLVKLDIDQLEELRAMVDEALDQAEKKRRLDALSEITTIAENAGMSIKELMEMSSGKSGKKKAPAKYRHPDDSSLTWSGRGRKPGWFAELVESGVDPDTLLVE